MSATGPRSHQLSELSACAYRLGLAFGGEAERAEDSARTIEYFNLFDRCFFAVRVATALQLRLQREPSTLRTEAREHLSVRAERDPPERDTADRDERERDREGDREREAASLPVLLRTLGEVAADAAALPGPEPAALPSLRELLARMTSTPAPAARSSGAGPGLRARLAASATAPILTLAPPARPSPRIPLPLRRATGPPQR